MRNDGGDGTGSSPAFVARQQEASVVAQESADRRRTRRGLLVAVGCVVLLGIGLPRLVDGGPEEGLPASGAATDVPVAVPPATGPPIDTFEGPTRGSLADEPAFLDAVRALPWSEEPPVRAADGTILFYLPDPPVEERNVVFAGDVPDGRWALVVGWTTSVPPEAASVPPEVLPHDTLVAAWFAGPPGATADQMTLASGPNSISGDWPVALTDPRTGALVVVAPPGDVVEVSPRPLIQADGSTTREWREVEAEDGVAIARLPALLRPYDGSTSYRVLRGGRIEARDVPWSIHTEQVEPELPIEFSRGQPSELGAQAARYGAWNALTELGLSSAEARITAHWAGPVPPGAAGEAAVVTLTLPSGAIVVHAPWLLPDGPDEVRTGTSCGQAILPAGPPAERRVHAVACEVFDDTSGTPLSTHLVVVGPPQVALIRTYDGDRAFLSEHPAHDGVVVVPLPLGTDRVEAVTDGGVTLGRVDLVRHAADFGD